MLIAVLIIVAIIAFFIIGIVSVLVKTKGAGYTKKDYARDKGKEGEYIVASILGNNVDGEKYIINNLIFADRKGRSCQIDHICINRYGIWVIETKNYSGQIYGSEEWHEWTQVLAYGEVKNRLYNPIKQNATHVYLLSNQIRAKGIFQNLVVFTGNADISNVHSANVCEARSLLSRINVPTGVVLSPMQMDRYYKRLIALKENNVIDEQEHIQNVRNLQNNIRMGICPRCGGALVLRDGKNGTFYGCAKYPKCKFTKKL